MKLFPYRWTVNYNRNVWMGVCVSLLCVFLSAARVCHATTTSSGLTSVTLATPDAVLEQSRAALREVMAEERKEHVDAGKDPDEFQFSGWGDDSALTSKAKLIAKQRAVPTVMSNRVKDVAAALRPHSIATADVLLSLPPVDGGAGARAADTTPSAAVLVRDPTSLSVAAAMDVAALTDDVTEGAIVNTGALPRDAGEWSELAHKSAKRSDRDLRMGDVDWLLGTEALEAAEADRNANETLRKEWEDQQRNVSAQLYDWFTSRGGRLTYVRPAGSSPSSSSDNPFNSSAVLTEFDGIPPFLEAVEDIGDGDVVVAMPLKLAMCHLSTRHVKTSRGSRLADALKPVFKQNERWGLAMLVLSEYFRHKEDMKPIKADAWDKAARKRDKRKRDKDNNLGSRWGPFLASIRVSLPSTQVLSMLEGTHALDVAYQWEADADDLEKWLRKKHICIGSSGDICSREPGRLGAQTFTHTDLRWALWVVRQYAVPVTKASTGKPFLALLPYSHLIRHSPGSGGSVTFEFDNTIRVAVGSHSTGDAINVDLGPMSDAESLLARRRVSEASASNPANTIRVSLPAHPTPDNDDDLFWQLDTLRQWRRAMHLPPRLSDMWRLTEQLHLFGEDEEEQRLLSGANTRVAGLPLPTDTATAEEQLMLLNGVDAADAQLAIYGDDRFSNWKPQLYTAPDVDDDPAIESVVEDLAESVRQLSDAVAAPSSDNATQSVINATKNFLVHGVMPSRGLDKVDQVLLRKISLLRRCGSADDYGFTETNVSAPLFCAMRVLLLNETDLDLVCPKADGPWTKPKCEDDDFDTTAPVSPDNERVTIQALRHTVQALQAHYTTTVEDDEAALRLDGLLPRDSVVRGAVVVRLREKQLLGRMLDDLDARLADVDGNTFSTTAAAAELEVRKAEEAKEAEWRRKVLEAAAVRAVVANVSVDLDVNGVDTQAFLVVREGHSLEDTVAAFARQHGIGPAGVTALTNAASAKAPSLPPLELAFPVVTPDGVRRVLTVHRGENATLAAKRFCLVHNVSKADAVTVTAEAAAAHATRLNRSVLLEVPVTGIDGRKLVLEVRQGEQHEVLTTASDFVTAYRQPPGFVNVLANEVLARLPPTVFTVPVTTPGRRRILLRVLDGDEPALETVVATFCEVWNLEVSSVGQLLGVVRRGLHPDALVNPQVYDPPTATTTTTTSGAGEPNH